MQSFFAYIKEHSRVKQPQVNDYLLAEFQYLLDSLKFIVLSLPNLIIYISNGQKKWLTSKKEKFVKKGSCFFHRKGVHSVDQLNGSQFNAIVLFDPITFVRSVLPENRIKTAKAYNPRKAQSIFHLYILLTKINFR